MPSPSSVFFVLGAAQGRRNRLSYSIVNEPAEELPPVLGTIPRLVFVDELYSSRFFVTPMEETIFLEHQSEVRTSYFGSANSVMFFISERLENFSLETASQYLEQGIYYRISMLARSLPHVGGLSQTWPKVRLLVWNCRGMVRHSQDFVGTLRDLKNQYKPNMVLLTETQWQEGDHHGAIPLRFPPANRFEKHGENNTGGIWFSWNDSLRVVITNEPSGFKVSAKPNR